MKKTPLISDGKTPLVWRKYPYGGQYAKYKLGTIVRYQDRYTITITSKQLVLHTKNLKDAKDKINKYTEARMKELRAKKKNHQIKKR